MEAESEKAMLRAQHEPKELPLDGFTTALHDSGEYLGEINERIDVLMSVRLAMNDALLIQGGYHCSNLTACVYAAGKQHADGAGVAPG